jgi:hypothetical protein
MATNKKLENAILDRLMESIDRDNNGMNARYKASWDSLAMLTREKITIRRDVVEKAGVPIYKIERRYSRRKINLHYPELKPRLVKIEAAQ